MCGISCPIKGQVQFAYPELVTVFVILDWDLDINGSGTFCIEVGPFHVYALDDERIFSSLIRRGNSAHDAKRFQWWRRCKEVQSSFCVEFPSHKSGAIIRIFCISLVHVKPARSNYFVPTVLSLLSWNFGIYHHLFKEVHFKLSRCNCPFLIHHVASDVVVEIHSFVEFFPRIRGLMWRGHVLHHLRNVHHMNFLLL